MKKILSTLFCAALLLTINAQEQDSLGLPGDHFSLQGTLELFKKSSSLEDFEEKLNKEDNYVNNLDLNEDGETDYIRVEDHMEGDVHAIVLQVPVNEKESQDIAVIEIEKTGNESAILQIIGDEELYGENYIVEPFEEDANSDGRGPNADYKVARVVVNVWFWSPIRYVYAPGYRVYVSPWRWAVYPRWWKPWRPHPWRWHYNKRMHYHVHYRPVSVHRVRRAHVVYTPKRKTSVTVRTRTVSKRTTVAKSTSVNRSKAVSTTTRTNKVSTGNTTVGKRSKTQVGAKKDASGNVTVGKRSKTQTGVKTKNKSVSKTKTTTTKAKKGKNAKGVKKTKTKTVKKKKKNG
jgi:hypothetical protein